MATLNKHEDIKRERVLFLLILFFPPVLTSLSLHIYKVFLSLKIAFF